jgi:hypothetical protein
MLLQNVNYLFKCNSSLYNEQETIFYHMFYKPHPNKEDMTGT